MVLERLGSHAVPVLARRGTLSSGDVAAAVESIADCLRSAPRVCVCDLTGLDPPFSDPVLLALPAALGRAGGWPRAGLHVAAGPELMRALRRSRVDRYVAVHPGLEAAVAAATDELDLALRELRLPAEARSVRAARAAVNQLWDECAGPSLGHVARGDLEIARDDALLASTELVTNAVIHVGRPFTLSLGMRADRILIAVTDAGAGEPIPQPLLVGALRGRGLQLVAALSEAWGTRLVHGGGKTVWARLTTASAARQAG